MRGLVDAQLPLALARSPSALGHDVIHVTDVGLTTATDRRIWDFAVTERRAIITKDEDFRARRAVAPPARSWSGSVSAICASVPSSSTSCGYGRRSSRPRSGGKLSSR